VLGAVCWAAADEKKRRRRKRRRRRCLSAGWRKGE